MEIELDTIHLLTVPPHPGFAITILHSLRSAPTHSGLQLQYCTAYAVPLHNRVCNHNTVQTTHSGMQLQYCIAYVEPRKLRLYYCGIINL